MTAMYSVPSRSAVAAMQYPASVVQPVFSPVQPSSERSRWLVLDSVYGLVGILLTYGGKKDLDQERLIQWMETLLTAIFQSMEKKNGA